VTRARWTSRKVFLLAAIGSAVGLGNIWRFPYLTYKYGGGAFLIPYLIALFVLGIPLLMLEFAIGQKLQRGAVDAFNTVHHKLRGIGVAAIFSGFVVVVYYAAVMAWSLLYFVNSFQSKVPWADDANGYFYGSVLQLSDSINVIGGINWYVFAALAAVWIGIYYCVRRGTDSVGKVVLITMPLPMILLFVLFIRGITLPGAWVGIFHYLSPDFSALWDPEIWTAAVSQIFFTLSLAFGIMIAYASFNKEDQDITGDAYITAFTNSGISLFAGFVVFSILGYMSTTTGTPFAEVATGGPGLAFVVFPQALALMPWAPFFSVLFFLTLLTLGIDSAFSLVEAVNTVIADKAKKAAKQKIAFYVCFSAFVLGIIFTTNAGLYLLDVVDHFVTNFGLIMVGIFECIAIGWVYKASRLREYINSVSRRKVGVWWDYMIKWFIPLVLTFLLILQFKKELMGNYEGYPDWAIAIGWLTVLVPLVIAVVLALKPTKVEVKI